MKKYVVLVRHGETRANLQRIIQGATKDSNLTTRGLEQMKTAGIFLKGLFRCAVVWSSSLGRAVNSARILVKESGFPKPILLDDLKQRDWGSVTGKTYDQQSGEVAYLGEPGRELPEDAESTLSIRRRLGRVIARIRRHTDKNHVIIGHNELLNYLLDVWRGSKWYKRSLLSGEVILLELTEKNRICISYKTIFPPKLVYVKDVPSFPQVEKALRILALHSMQITTELTPDNCAHVVAIALGDTSFGLKDVKRFPRLRTVARFGAGSDNVDIKALWSARRISVSCTVGLATKDVAEFALAMLIVVLRRAHIDALALKTKPNLWRSIERGSGLSGVTVGILGCGHIGAETAKLIRRCGGRVLLWNRSWPPTQVPSHGLGVFEKVSLRELAQKSDAVSIHIALTNKTRNLIGRRFFDEVQRVHKSIVLVNTSRGEIVNERELLRAIKAGIVSSAAIDVWSHEGKKTDATIRALRRHPLVFASSHIAAYTIGVRERYALQCARNIIALVEARTSEVKEFIVAP